MNQITWVAFSSLLAMSIGGPHAGPSHEVPQGPPRYASTETKALIESVVEAYGGMDAWKDVRALRYRFFTRVTNQSPFFSIETIDRATGNALIEWPVFNATVGWNGTELWSMNWPDWPLPAGFFARLTYSFVTLPFRTQDRGVTLGALGSGRLPGDSVDYTTVRMTYDHRNPSMPGDYYVLYIDADSKLIRGLEFNITHPGMVRVPGQALGPNFHLFDEYGRFGNLILPTFYRSTGVDAQGKPTSGAIHSLFDVHLDRGLSPADVAVLEGAVLDRQSMEFWKTR